MIAATMVGCEKSKHEAKNVSVEPNNVPANVKKKENPVAVAIGEANNTRSDWVGPTILIHCFPIKFHIGRENLWFIEWKSANLALVDGKQSGFMFKVHGNVFEKNVPAGEFFADHAEADRAVDRLVLEGNIRIVSESFDKVTKLREISTMTAKKVEWLAGNEVFKASGDVYIDGPNGAVGPVDVLFVSAKLKKVASSLKYFTK